MFEPLPITTMAEDEFSELHGRISLALRLAGLTGPTLDHALSDAFRIAVRHVETARQHDATRRENIQLVGGVDA